MEWARILNKCHSFGLCALTVCHTVCHNELFIAAGPPVEVDTERLNGGPSAIVMYTSKVPLGPRVE